ncbi:hypothetical protein BSKO_06605 [Bryopsis sp. KO-2023]|nr:hypothetical protein BSKO_06605 [Bryopsis sp. KO-2023]
MSALGLCERAATTLFGAFCRRAGHQTARSIVRSRAVDFPQAGGECAKPGFFTPFSGFGHRFNRPMCNAAVMEGVSSVETDGWTERSDVRNVAIIAHVDHGKTTLVDAMLKQSRVFRENQAMQERIMDSNDLERERGITILSKNTAVRYKGIKINIIDTPGHADFGGEVERVLNMCDGVLLLVDAVEGPMPQTRFVLKKALELEKKVILVVNKIDRPAARPDFVIDAAFELFLELGASDEQCNFPVVYASGIKGISGETPEDLQDNLEPLFKAVVNEISPPRVRMESPLQMLVTNIDYDEHKGRIAIGRAAAGTITKGAQIGVCRSDEDGLRLGKLSNLFVYDNFEQVPADEVQAGDICAVTGIPDVKIGDTIVDPENPLPLPTISVEEPTVTMTFLVNTSPFAGKEGKYVTSRNIKDRLDRELERNLALRVTRGDSADTFIVSGRGGLHLGILIETMRREGYEFAVGPMMVILKSSDGQKLEPYEEAVVEAPEEHVGAVVDLFGRRKGRMLDMSPGLGSMNILKYVIPTRGLLGLRSHLLTNTKGTAVLNTNFSGYEKYCGEIDTRENGSLVATEMGAATSYALEALQSRGTLFVKPGDEIYEGMVVGMNARSEDLKVNVCKKKALTNVRSANKDQTTVLNVSRDHSLDEALEYVGQDELVEITPESVRIRKSPKAAKK